MLASCERRLAAAALDGVVVLFAMMLLYGLADLGGGTNDALSLSILLVAFVAYHAAALRHPYLGFGRMVLRIAVVPVRGGAIPWWRAVLRPVVRLLLLAVGGILSYESMLPWLIALPVLVELGLVLHSPSRRSVADRVAGTIVVMQPPMQPHRAPAFPMYSARDEEFGPRP